MLRIQSKHASAALAAFAVACLLAAVPTMADEKDEENPRLGGWGQVINPDHDCEIDLKGGAVEVKVPGTRHDFGAELEIQNAPRVLFELKGDFVVEVKVSGAFEPGATSTIPGRRPYHGAGLLVIKDKNNYISLHRGCVNLDGQSRHYANFELRKDAELAVSLYEIEIADQETYLRLERRGDRVFEATSHDGVHWTSYDPISLDLPDSVQVGVVGISSSEVPLSIKFEDLKVFRKAEVE